MEKREVEELAHNLFSKHGLSVNGWLFEIYNRKRDFGMCFHTKKKICLSKYFIKHSTYEQIKQILLHEIAHALCGRGFGHGRIFKNKCEEIGCIEDGYCLTKFYLIPEAAVYKFICKNCGIVEENYRKSKQIELAIKNNKTDNLYSCSICKSKCTIERGKK